jgi:hypothetical protein
VVLINADDEPQTYPIADLKGADLALHPVQLESADPLVKESSFDTETGTFNAPGRTTAVFVALVDQGESDVLSPAGTPTPAKPGRTVSP